MRSLLLTIGLLSALISAGAAIAAETQEDDRSYLPPVALRATPGTAPAKSPAARGEPANRQVRAARRHPGGHRESHRRQYAGRRLFFGLF